MKNILIPIIFILTISTQLFGQRERGSDPKEKIRELEKIKLIETLDMNEETSIKFFTRRKEHIETTKKIFDDLETNFREIEDRLSSSRGDNDPELKKLVDSHHSLQLKLEEEKIGFINSLKDILTNKQIAQLIIFEKHFKEEIRNILFHSKKRKWDRQ